jgi:DNA-binding transcriptional ArsR family regulator
VTAVAERAEVFAALGDLNRLRILDQLTRAPASATTLVGELAITRQAVAKHLRVLEGAGLVAAARAGREVRFELRADQVERAARWLDDVAVGWERRLAAVKRTAEQQ